MKPVVRHLLALLALCFLASAFGLFAAGGRYEVREIQPSVFVWLPEDIIEQDGDPQFSRAANAGFIITDEGVVVVNTTNSPFHARELLYEIRHRTARPIQQVINTNASGDQILGNEVFAELQALTLSTAATQVAIEQYEQELARRMEAEPRLQARMRGIHVRFPNRSFDHEVTLRVGGQEIRLLDLSPGPSTGDAAVYLPGAKVLFLGDLFAHDYFPRIGSRDVRRWIEILRQVQTWDVEIYVPGHGLPGSKRELAEFRQFLELLTREVESRIKAGKSLDQMKREVGSLANPHWHAPELAVSAVEAVYEQLSGQPPASIPGTPASTALPKQSPPLKPSFGAAKPLRKIR